MLDTLRTQSRENQKVRIHLPVDEWPFNIVNGSRFPATYTQIVESLLPVQIHSPPSRTQTELTKFVWLAKVKRSAYAVLQEKISSIVRSNSNNSLILYINPSNTHPLNSQTLAVLSRDPDTIYFSAAVTARTSKE